MKLDPKKKLELKAVQSPTCGHVYSKLQLKLSNITLIGVPKDSYGIRCVNCHKGKLDLFKVLE